MEDGGEAKSSAEVFGVSPDGKQCIGGGFKEEVIEKGFVLIGDLSDLAR